MATTTAQTSRIEEKGIAAYAAEFIGTLLLVLFIALVLSENSAQGLGFTDFAVIGLLHFFLLMMLVHTLGGASGAHFNPAVTVTLAALRKITVPDAAVYVLLQLAGGVAGALIAMWMLADVVDPANYGAVGISEKFLDGQMMLGFFAEAVGTFALMWAILGVAVNPRGAKDWAGLVIGGTLGFVVFTIGPLTGAGVNPARAFGPAIVSGEWGGAGEWIVAYAVGPIVGALLAGLLYTALVLAPQDREGVRPVDTLD